MDKPIDEAVELLRAFQSQFGSCRPDDDEDDAETWDRINRVCDTLTAAQQQQQQQGPAVAALTTVRFLDGGVVQMDRSDYNNLIAAPPSAPVGLVEAATNALEWIAAGPEGKQAHSALKRALAQQPAAVDGVAWIVEREGDPTFPRVFTRESDADGWVRFVELPPFAKKRPLVYGDITLATQHQEPTT